MSIRLRQVATSKQQTKNEDRRRERERLREKASEFFASVLEIKRREKAKNDERHRQLTIQMLEQHEDKLKAGTGEEQKFEKAKKRRRGGLKISSIKIAYHGKPRVS